MEINITPATMLLITALIGQISPALVDTINKNIGSPRLRFLMSILFAAIVGTILNINALNFGNIDGVLNSALIVWASSQTAYKMWYEDSKLQYGIRYSKTF